MTEEDRKLLALLQKHFLPPVSHEVGQAEWAEALGEAFEILDTDDDRMDEWLDQFCDEAWDLGVLAESIADMARRLEAQEQRIAELALREHLSGIADPAAWVQAVERLLENAEWAKTCLKTLIDGKGAPANKATLLGAFNSLRDSIISVKRAAKGGE